eukprot:2350239-Amphidinium_carterae.1
MLRLQALGRTDLLSMIPVSIRNSVLTSAEPATSNNSRDRTSDEKIHAPAVEAPNRLLKMMILEIISNTRNGYHQLENGENYHPQLCGTERCALMHIHQGIPQRLERNSANLFSQFVRLLGLSLIHISEPTRPRLI